MADLLPAHGLQEFSVWMKQMQTAMMPAPGRIPLDEQLTPSQAREMYQDGIRNRDIADSDRRDGGGGEGSVDAV